MAFCPAPVAMKTVNQFCSPERLLFKHVGPLKIISLNAFSFRLEEMHGIYFQNPIFHFVLGITYVLK